MATLATPPAAARLPACRASAARAGACRPAPRACAVRAAAEDAPARRAREPVAMAGPAALALAPAAASAAVDASTLEDVGTPVWLAFALLPLIWLVVRGVGDQVSFERQQTIKGRKRGGRYGALPDDEP